jgi:hypothetical protein
MIRRRRPQIGVEERLSARRFAAVLRFHGREDGVHLREHIRIVGLEHPPPVRLAVRDRRAGRCLARPFPTLGRSSPRKPWRCDTRIADRGRRVEDDQRLPLGVEHAAKGLALVAVRVHVGDIGNVQFPRAHQLPYIPVRREELLIAFRRFVPIPEFRG